MKRCQATTGHCCWLEGPVCRYLRDDGPDAQRRFVCTFFERLGNWDAVHADPVYQAEIAPLMLRLTGVLCGDWPPPGQVCAECGAGGDG